MLALGEAVARVVQNVRPLPPERVRLDEANGRVLATDVRAPLTLPPLDNSAMDGYAVRGADVAGATADAPVALPVLESIAAGAFPTRRVRRDAGWWRIRAVRETDDLSSGDRLQAATVRFETEPGDPNRFVRREVRDRRFPPAR